MDFVKNRTTVFKGKGLFHREEIILNEKQLIYRKRSSVFSPLLTLTVSRQNIKEIEITRIAYGVLLRIETFSNNNIVTRNFSRGDAEKIKALLN